MRLSDFDFLLPPELIAQEPLPDRAGARMLIVDRAAGTFRDAQFRDFPGYVMPGDCLILNNTRVFPSRLLGTREGATGQVEIFLTRALGEGRWLALVKPGKKLRVGERVRIADDLHVEILDHGEFGERTVRLETSGDVYSALERAGHVPLPPYIRRADTAADRERYQTVFARERGSVAAPTAGLHFTPEVLEQCRAVGAEVAQVTLHVGLGTFAPLRTDVIEEVKLHSELVEVGPEAIAAMERAKRVVAIGTTSVRAIESPPGLAETDIFISPGFRFQRTGAMLTNFHLPKSSLLVLVCAFAGTDLALSAYRHAVSERYRFFSYGDCMLII
ncbi:MAG: tRNA preQ1(34) S-adenosylmethionine ribosyltransferase-isomerase QueA [Acidobacteriota bacterium]